MITKFSKRFNEKSNADLQYIVDNPKAYQNEAVLTAKFILESRSLATSIIAEEKNKRQQPAKVVDKKETSSSTERTPSNFPKSISNAAKLIYIAAGLGIINPILIELTLGIQSFSHPRNLIIILLSTGILGFLGYQISRGENWAKNVFTVLLVLGLLVFPLVIIETFRVNPVAGVFSLTQALLQAFAVFLLFKSESRIWYNYKKNKGFM